MKKILIELQIGARFCCVSSYQPTVSKASASRKLIFLVFKLLLELSVVRNIM